MNISSAFDVRAAEYTTLGSAANKTNVDSGSRLAP